MRVVDALDKAIELSIKNGTIDPVVHGATIEAARKVASMMDDPSWPMVNGKLDNVSPGVFLKYCDALGICPDAKQQKPKKHAKVSAIDTSRYSKMAKNA